MALNCDFILPKSRCFREGSGFALIQMMTLSLREYLRHQLLAKPCHLNLQAEGSVFTSVMLDAQMQSELMESVYLMC